MSITTEWAKALDTSVSLALRGDHLAGSELPVESDLALIFDPRSGGALVVEGTSVELLRLLEFARETVATYDDVRRNRARAALDRWDTFADEHADLAARADRGEISYDRADQFEDEARDLADDLADAIRTLLR